MPVQLKLRSVTMFDGTQKQKKMHVIIGIVKKSIMHTEFTGKKLSTRTQTTIKKHENEKFYVHRLSRSIKMPSHKRMLSKCQNTISFF